jgi:hypothetical protein
MAKELGQHFNLKNVNAAAFATLEQSLTSVELHTDY